MANGEVLNRKDPLTGFHTKDGLNEYLNSKIISVYEKPESLSVIILDLDNFKGINDKYGHLVGDDALRFFSLAINIALKGQHFVARYGGDEFVIVLFDNEQGKESLEVAGRIKMVLSKEKFTIARGAIKIRTSIGIANYPRDGKSAREVLEVADKALYYAKKHGKNKVISSRNMKVVSLKNKFVAAVQAVIIIALIVLAVVTYGMTGSGQTIVTYFQDMQNFLSFEIMTQQKKYNYIAIEMKDGKSAEGWIIKEDASNVQISLSKPFLRFNPFKFINAASSQPIKIPKSAIQSYVKQLKR